jgi:hypothetical protein
MQSLFLKFGFVIELHALSIPRYSLPKKDVGLEVKMYHKKTLHLEKIAQVIFS